MKPQSSLVAGALVALVLGAGAASAQVMATVRGRVLDEKGKPVAEATVTFESIGGVTGKPVEVLTNKKGEFDQERLMPGTYKISITKEGFATAASNFPLTRAQTLMIPDVKLQPAAPDHTGAFRKAVELANAGKFDEAEAAFREVIAKAGESAVADYNLGFIYAKRQDFANAEASYKKAIALDPKLADPYKGLANLFQQQKRWNDAIAFFTEATAAQPQNGYLVYELGLAQREAGKHEEAYANLLKAAALSPDNPEIEYHAGTTAINLGKTDAALAHLQKYLSMNPTNQQNIDSANGLIPYLKPQGATAP
jgi:tetratricopeptide (TPR) repeat protein